MPDGQHFAFLALARDLGLLGAEDAASLRDSETPAYQAAVQRQLLSPETARGVQGALERGHFSCARCSLDLRYGHLGTLPSLACPTCGQTLAYREPQAGRPPSERRGRAPSERHSGLGRAPSDRHSPGRAPSDRNSGLGRAPSDRNSGLGRAPSDRNSGLGRAPSDRNSGLGRAPSDRNSGLGRAPSDRNSGLGRTGRPSSRRAKSEGGPKQIGDFLLERQLGRGNNGVVYLARRSGLDRQFAVKILLHTSKLGDEARERFRLEAQIGSKLSHPGIVPVYDIGEEQDFLYFAMQYVPGEDLAQRLEREVRLPPNQAAQLVRDLAESLVEAHAQQVVHRDLKPANVLLPEDGSRPRLTDFGLAKDRELAESMTKSGDILGSPFYMAPEQLQGARVTALADVYALGVILYQCLTGRRPYEAKTPFDLAKKVMAGDCVDPGQLIEGLPADLVAICRRAMHVKPEERTASAEDLRRELSDFLAGRRVKAPGARRVTPLAIGVGSLLALVLGVGLTLGLASLMRTNPEFEVGYAALQAQPPAGAAELDAALAKLERLEPTDPRLGPAQTWAGGWRALWRADEAIARGALSEAKGALESAAAAVASGPFLEEAHAQRVKQVAQSEVLLALQAEVRGRPLGADVLSRWRELRAQVEDPGLQWRIRSALMDCLADRQRLKEFQEELAELSEPERVAQGRLREGWLCFELGRRDEALRSFKVLAKGGSGVPESVRLAAAGLVESIEGRREDARPLFRAALREEPEFALVKFWLAVNLAITGRLSEADRLLSEVEVRFADNVAFAVWRSRIHLTQQKPREGLILAQRALSLLGEQRSERALVAAYFAALVVKDAASLERYTALAQEAFPGSSPLELIRGLHLNQSAQQGSAMQVWTAAWKRDRKGFEAAAYELLSGSAKQLLEAVRQAAEGRTGARFFLPLGEVDPKTQARLERRVSGIAHEEARSQALAGLRALAGGQPYEGSTARAFERARELAPEDLTLAWLYAEALLGRDRFPEAQAAFETCRRLGGSERRVQLYLADLALRQGRFSEAEEIYGALARGGRRDVPWFCAQAMLLRDQEGEGVKRALALLTEAKSEDRMIVYTFIRISFHHPDRRHIRQAILTQFVYEGLFDCGTLAFYCFEQARRLYREKVPGLLELAGTASQRLTQLTKAAWPRLGLCHLTLRGRPSQRWILGWVRDRLEEAGHVEPKRPRVHLLRGVLAVLSGQKQEDLFFHWDRAKELGSKPVDFADWAETLRGRLEGVDLSRYLEGK